MSFEHETPEDVQAVCESALSTARNYQVRGEHAAAAVYAVQAAVHLGNAQVLDRLERIILLLDERLPRAGDGLAGTVEGYRG